MNGQDSCFFYLLTYCIMFCATRHSASVWSWRIRSPQSHLPVSP